MDCNGFERLLPESECNHQPPLSEDQHKILSQLMSPDESNTALALELMKSTGLKIPGMVVKFKDQIHYLEYGTFAFMEQPEHACYSVRIKRSVEFDIRMPSKYWNKCASWIGEVTLIFEGVQYMGSSRGSYVRPLREDILNPNKPTGAIFEIRIKRLYDNYNL